MKLHVRNEIETLSDEHDVHDRTYAEFSRDRARAHDTGGNATRERDENDSTAKAKQENPEAPDVVIGMQDERGGKGI